MFWPCARLSKSVADEEVCLFAVVDLRSSGSERRSSAEFKDRSAMAITSRAARNTMTAVETTPAVVGPGAYLSTERPQSCLLRSIRLLLRHPHLATYELQGWASVYQRAPREDRTAAWTLPLGVCVCGLSAR